MDDLFRVTELVEQEIEAGEIKHPYVKSISDNMC
jgi:hypothetical protein